MSGPPRLARRVLRFTGRVLQLPGLADEADELYAQRAGTMGERAARRWYVRQAVAGIVHVPGALVRRPSGLRGIPLGVLSRQALRRALRTPALSVPFVGVVGLGMGATAFMAQTKGAVLRPGLGHGREVWRVDAFDSAGARVPMRFAETWAAHADEGAGRLLPIATSTMAVETPAGRVSATGQTVPPDLFRAIGVRPVIGRDARGPDEVVVSHGFWRAYWGADRSAIGQTVRVNGRLRVLVGVAPPDFDALQCCVRMDLWLVGAVPEPVVGSAIAVEVRDPDAASVVFRRILNERDPSVARITLTPADAAAFGGERGIVGRALGLVFGLAVLAWLGTVSGAVNLLFADLSERGREMRLRAALGGGPAAPVAQLLLETAWLTVCAAAVAGLTAWSLLAIAPRVMPLITPDSVFDMVAGAPALRSILVAVVTTCALCGLAAGVVASRLSVRAAVDRGPARSRASAAILCVQVTLATALVVTSLQFLRELRARDGEFTGFRDASAAVFTLSLDQPASRGLAAYDLVRRMSAPSAGTALSRRLPVLGAPVDSLRTHAGSRAVAVEGVSEGYFHAIGLRLVSGRAARDSTEMVVSADLLTGASPANVIGSLWQLRDASVRIVGVAESATWGTGAPRPTVYQGWSPGELRSGFLLAPSLRGQSASLSAILSKLRGTPYAAASVGTLGDLLTRSRVLDAFLARMALVFGCLCLAVALFGVHAQVTRWLRARQRELGIRWALGAERSRLRLFVVQAFALPLTCGALAGAVLGLAALRALAAVYTGTEGWAAASALQGSALVLLAGGATAFLAAVRLRHLDPLRLLREA